VSSFGVVVDACVLYPAALRDTLLRAAAADLYRLHWSDEILEEARRNLVENEAMPADRADRLVAAMVRAFPEARVVGFEALIPAMTNQAKDRHVLAAAVAAGAQVIVTSNLRHFPGRALAPFSVEAQSPDEFLASLADLAPRTMVRILREQAAALKNPPLTVEDVLDDVGLQAPRFAELMRHLLVTTP
jgi:predicted nucleic acid-binding protein